MNKKQGVPKGIPIIGDKQKNIDLVNNIMSQLQPVVGEILTAIDGLERRVAVVEEVKKIFPDKVEVTVRHEHETKDEKALRVQKESFEGKNMSGYIDREEK